MATRRLTCAMRLHDRYLFRALLTPLAFCLGAFLVFWVSLFFFKNLDEIREAKLTLVDALELCATNLPEFLVLLLPMLLLLALLYALTQHAKANELTALRAAGISLWRLCAPYFAVGLAATAIFFALNELAVPRCAAWADAIKHRYVNPGKLAVNNSPTRFYGPGFENSRAHRLWRFDEFDALTTEMLRPNVTWSLPDGSLRNLSAARGVHANGHWIFFKANLSIQANAKSHLAPLFATNQISLPEFSETPEQIVSSLKFSVSQAWTSSRNADLPLAEIRALIRTNPGMSADYSNALNTKFHARLAAPWTCLVVVLMAIPFGAQSGRRNLFFGVAGSIFICFTYFVLQQFSLALGVGGHLPGWLAAWLPNFIFAAAGFILILRTR
jgi:lipopolysaccharide export system permease protein